MNKRVHVFYTGAVQGVGFRFTAREIAKDLGVFGWICNLGDGRVELVAEAREDVLKEFLERINRNFSRYIDDRDILLREAKGEFGDFKIRT